MKILRPRLQLTDASSLQRVRRTRRYAAWSRSAGSRPVSTSASIRCSTSAAAAKLLDSQRLATVAFRCTHPAHATARSNSRHTAAPRPLIGRLAPSP